VIEIKSQAQDSSYLNKEKLSWFISVNYGAQMSGIKDEDFVSTNYSPLLNITLGKVFSPLFSIQLGYKGFYFNYIDDDFKHHYNFYYAEVLFSPINALYPTRNNKDWDLMLHAGIGIFDNNFLNKNQGCVNVGVQNNFKITDNIQAIIDISSIVGWRIYQGDEDILPSISVGIIYLFE